MRGFGKLIERVRVLLIEHALSSSQQIINLILRERTTLNGRQHLLSLQSSICTILIVLRRVSLSLLLLYLGMLFLNLLQLLFEHDALLFALLVLYLGDGAREYASALHLTLHAQINCFINGLAYQ